MATIKTKIDRRSFIQVSALTGGGMILGFSWLAGCKMDTAQAKSLPENWYDLNGYLKIGENGLVTIMSPNPEIGQNVKTSMPMLIAEELDVNWADVLVEQAPLNTEIFSRQIAGGSQSIRQSWKSLRMAGATARHMLKSAAAQQWQLPIEELTTAEGYVIHEASNQKLGYGELASLASSLEVPEEVELKRIGEFTIIGSSKKNVDGKKIVTGQPLFGLDYKVDDMDIAMIIHPPAFGLKLKSFDAAKALSMPGVKDVFTIQLFPTDYKQSAFDNTSFDELVVVTGASTWQVMQAKKEVICEWQQISASKITKDFFGRDMEFETPAESESTTQHTSNMLQLDPKLVKEVRKDGDFDHIYKNSAKSIERHYTAPFLAHNTMEPMNFFADVTAEKATLVGPIQTPEIMEKSITAILGMPLENIDIQMTRMGGGFGRRLYGHFLIEAALISKKTSRPTKLIYTREDDMTSGIYRPAYSATYRAALDENNNLVAFYVRAGGIPESPLAANRFPAGAVDNYTAEEWSIPSNISVGAFRAPRSNFIAGAEQAFLDEVAELAGKDPIAFRLELLKKAEENPVGENNDYDAKRYAGVLELVREKSNWKNPSNNSRGVAAYFCHNTYVAQVVELSKKDEGVTIENVTAAVDCGFVVNPDAATNLCEGGIVDGIGHGLYSKITFENGYTDQKNFDKYRLIRHKEAPKKIDVHFVKNDIDPTGLGEPLNPPIIGAVANALYQLNGKRYYDQPFLNNQDPIG